MQGDLRRKETEDCEARWQAQHVQEAERRVAEDALLQERDRQQRVMADQEQQQVLREMLNDRADSQTEAFQPLSPEPEAGEAGFGAPPPGGTAFQYPYNNMGRTSPADGVGNLSNSSRFQSNVHKYFYRLKKAILVVQEGDEGKGSKLLALNLKELQGCRKELDSACNEADKQGEYPEEIRGKLEAGVNLLPQLERDIAAAQD